MPLLDVILGYDCNLACDYCTITPAMRARSLPTAVVRRELGRGRADGFDAVQLTGGEPTIRPDLLPLVRAASTLGFPGIKIQSNGLMWSSRRNVERALEAGANTFSVSIHSHDPRTYDDMVRRPDSHDLMAAGIDNLVSVGADPSADVIIKSNTQAGLADAVAWLAGRRVRRVDFWFVSLTDGNRDNVASMPRMTDAVPHLQAALALARERDMVARSLHIPRCLLGADAAHAWDPAAQGVRVITPDAIFDLAHSKLTPQTHVPACEGCEHRPVCPGIRRDYLERFGDAEIATARGVPCSLPPSRSPRHLPLATG